VDKLNDQEILLEDNSVNEPRHLMENVECNPEFLRKWNRSSRKNKTVQKKNWKQELNYDCGEECDVEFESDENDQFWVNDSSNSSNKSHITSEESRLELNLEDQVGFDIFIEEQLNEDHCLAEVVNGDKQEMNESSLLRLLEQYKNEKNQNNAISMEMEAAIELLSLVWKSNASFQLYSKIVKWAEHFFPRAAHEKLPS